MGGVWVSIKKQSFEEKKRVEGIWVSWKTKK